MKTIKLFVLLAASAFLFACGSADNGSSSGPGGTATFKSNGGSAFVNLSTASATGGSGGGINFDIYGDVKVSTGGSVDTSFTVPTYNAGYGTKKLTVSSNTAVKFWNFSTATYPPSGDIYVQPSDRNLYESTGTAGTPISGLEVKAGAVLTLPANYIGDGSSYIQLDLPYAITIDGTVKPAAEGVELRLKSYSLFQIGTSGTVTTKPTTVGTDGANIYLYGEVAINKGTIDASGSAATAAETAGGSAGYINLEADFFLYNTGSILAKGGTSTRAAGGQGRHIHLFAYSASLFNSGTIDNSGGNGATYGGRAGWNIRLNGGSEGYVGSVIVSGSLLNNGGTGGTGDGGSCPDGIYLDSHAGKVWSNATISAKGGTSTSAAGGNGGGLDLYGGYGTNYVYNDGSGYEVESKGIKLSGNIDLSGGNGATIGGLGGSLDLGNGYLEAGLLPTPAAEMVGFASFTMDGGAGAIGGDGGYFGIYNGSSDSYWIADVYSEVSVGSIVNQVPVSAKGGAGSMIASKGRGGNGGWIDFDCGNDTSLLTTITTSNSGAINISGGAGNAGGNGGGVYMYGYGKLTNSGAINAKGGAGTTSGGAGDGDYAVDFYSSYDIENSGAIDASGGSGITGGDGAYVVEMYAGGQTRNSAAITSAGGAGTTTGGRGGDIDLFSEMLPTSNTGGLTVIKGTGGTTALDGWIWIDGVDVDLVHDLNPT